MIIYTCPECGGDLMNLVLTSHPPIPEKYCMRCGWRWVGHRPDTITRVPFNPNNT